MRIHATTAAQDSSKFKVQSSKLPSATPTLNLEPGTLNSTGRRNGHDSPELQKAFTDFVGQTFFGELVKQMRATVKKPAFFHGGMGEDIFQSQLDQIMVERISDVSAKSFSDPMYQLFMAPRS
jgi:peptidoglycan hydrolase FlgJ